MSLVARLKERADAEEKRRDEFAAHGALGEANACCDRTRQLAVRVRAAACGVPHLLVAATSLTREVLPTLKAAEAKLRKIASRS